MASRKCKQGKENDLRDEMIEMFLKELSMLREENKDQKIEYKKLKNSVDESLEFMNKIIKKMLK